MLQDNTPETTPTADTPTTTNPPAGLQLQDLIVILQTLQVTAQRGAIRAEEMALVGGVYERLFAFLEAQGAVSRGPATTDVATGDKNA